MPTNPGRLCNSNVDLMTKNNVELVSHHTAIKLLHMSVKWAKNVPAFACLPEKDQVGISYVVVIIPPKLN